ncbi:hypothetical protein ACRAQ6_13870 [Erythrobacter sp. HA6-11]
MVRRRSPPAKDITLPEGWTAHDGGRCPIAPDSMPKLMFRMGTRTSGDRTAASWGNMWQHDGGPMDIIAFKLDHAAR